MKKGIILLVISISLLCLLPALAEWREVHRPSELGGTGMLFQRIGDQLDPKEMNASLFIEWLNFSGSIPLNPTRVGEHVFMDDPRGDEFWGILTYNYGINNIVELGIQIPFLYNDNPTTSDIDVEWVPHHLMGGTQKYRYSGTYEYDTDLRESGVGRIGVDARFLWLNKDRMGGGLSTTLWASAPSFMDVSSEQINGGIEMNFTLEGKSFQNYFGSKFFDRALFEKMSNHVTMGWGFDDYLEFAEYDHIKQFRQLLRELNITDLQQNNIEIKTNDINTRDPRRPQFVAAEFINASYGLEFEVYDRTFIGSEILWKQYVNEYHNDNNVTIIFPEIAYTYHDAFTLSAAFGMTAFFNFKNDDLQPEMLAKVGFTYHFPSLYKGALKPVNPTNPQDIFDIFVPSRKPIPIQTQEKEETLPAGEGEDGGEE